MTAFDRHPARARVLPFRRQQSSKQHRHEHHHPQLLPLTAFDRRPELLKEVIAHTLEEEVLSFTGDKAKLDFAFEGGSRLPRRQLVNPVSRLWNPSELSRYVRTRGRSEESSSASPDDFTRHLTVSTRIAQTSLAWRRCRWPRHRVIPHAQHRRVRSLVTCPRGGPPRRRPSPKHLPATTSSAAAQ